MLEKNQDQSSPNDQEIQDQEIGAEQEPIDLDARLAEAEAKAAEYLDGWQRSRAEFANFRRRQEQMQMAIRQQMISDLLEEIIFALDDQERAYQAMPAEMHDHPWVEGLLMADKKLRAVLEKGGLSEMQVAPGDDFDPAYHQAILHEPSNRFEEGKVVDVLQKGYWLKDSVLRPAVVRVSSGKVDEKE